MMDNEFLLLYEARRRMIERLDQAGRQALVAAARITRPPFRVRLGERLVRLGHALQASSLRPEPARALGD